MQSNHVEGMHMWSSFKMLIEDIRLSSNVAVTVTKNKKLLIKKNLFFVTIAAIFHKRPGLATIALKVDDICIISIKFGGNWLYTGF
jgi:hypothetical protein